MTFIKKIIRFLFTMIISVMAAVAGFFPATAPMLACAEGMTVGYSDVLTDLKKDTSFKVSDFPEYTYEEIKTSDKELLDVISLAEGSEQELFLYVYNPTRKYLDITATEVSMYCEYAANPKEFHPQTYDLKLVSKYSVFDKYVVEGFSVSDKADRYYNIIEISRPFDENIDTSIEGGTTENKAIPVAKQWYCYYYNNELIYEMGEFNVLEITPTLTGNVKYENGYTIGNIVGNSKSCNSHFIAFNCENYVIKHIYDADLEYSYRKVTEYDDYLFDDDEITYPSGEDYQDSYVTITDQDEVTFEGKGIFGKTFQWNRISTASAFVESYEDQGGVLNKISKETLLKSQWVFCFTETEYKSVASNTNTGLVVGKWHYYTEVSNVDILRISFLDINGRYYNLGVVSDKVTQDNIDDGVAGGVKGLPQWLLNILEAIKNFFTNKDIPLWIKILVVVLVLAFPGLLTVIIKEFGSYIAKGLKTVGIYIGKGLLLLLKGIGWVLFSPIRLFKLFIEWLRSKG